MAARRKRQAFKEAKKLASEKKMQQDDNESENTDTEMELEVFIPFSFSAFSHPIYYFCVGLFTRKWCMFHHDVIPCICFM